MRNKTSEFLEKARLALQKGDQKKAISHLNQVLQQDINHAEAWQMLYKNVSRGESFDDFQQNYTKKYFPRKLKELNLDNNRSIRRVSLTGGRESSARGASSGRKPDAPPPPPKEEKKPGFFARLFGRKHDQVSIRLADSRERYRLPRYRAHHALTDALATAELLQAQVAHRFAPDTPLRALWQ